MNLVFNKDILGILFDDLEDDVDFLLFVKQNNIKVKEGIKWKDLNWASICENNELTEEFMDEFGEYLEWGAIVTHQQISEDVIDKYGDLIDWGLISEFQVLSEKFMSDNREDLDWSALCYKQKMSNDFVMKHKEDVEWEAILDSISIGDRKPMNEKMLRECCMYFDETCWEAILDNDDWELSEKFLVDFMEYFDSNQLNTLVSYHICLNGNIDEDFIEKYKEYLDMGIILNEHPDLSDEFLRTHSLFGHS